MEPYLSLYESLFQPEPGSGYVRNLDEFEVDDPLTREADDESLNFDKLMQICFSAAFVLVFL